MYVGDQETQQKAGKTSISDFQKKHNNAWEKPSNIFLTDPPAP